MEPENSKAVETIIVGGGQSGLALGYWLARSGHDFLILDEHARSGDAWRQRWDSLRLFTPAKYDGLPGAPFPGDRVAFPSKDELADYLEKYARTFNLPVEHRTRVDGIEKMENPAVTGPHGSRFTVRSGSGTWHARNVVIATGGYGIPRRPEFADALHPGIRHFHSVDYRNPGQLQPGGVLVVGLGNSGAEIALEASRTHPTSVAGKPGGEIPVRHGRFAARTVLPVIRFLGMYVLTVDNPVGRKAAAAFHSMATPLIRTRTKELRAAGVDVLPRVAGTHHGRPVLADGRVLDIANVIWCTGYREDYSWVKLPRGAQLEGLIGRRGVVDPVPGLYVLGREFQFAAASATLPGIGRDARYTAEHFLRAQHDSSRSVMPHTESMGAAG